MAEATYVEVSGVARKVKQHYVGVSGIARKIRSGFVGVNGIARNVIGSRFLLSWYLTKGAATNVTHDYAIYENGYVYVSVTGTQGANVNGSDRCRAFIEITPSYNWAGQTITFSATSSGTTSFSNVQIMQIASDKTSLGTSTCGSGRDGNFVGNSFTILNECASLRLGVSLGAQGVDNSISATFADIMINGEKVIF